MDTFTAAFIECLLWSETDHNGEPFDGYTADDIHPDTLAEIEKDCADFLESAHDMICDNLKRAGHDFCLSRNGHGAGFWDGGWPEHGDTLHDMAKSCGSIYLAWEDGDGGRIIHHG